MRILISQKDWCNRCIYYDHPCDFNRKYRFSLFVSSMESSCSMGVTYFKRICNVLFLAEIQAMRKINYCYGRTGNYSNWIREENHYTVYTN